MKTNYLTSHNVLLPLAGITCVHLGTTVEVGRVNVSSDREEYSLTYTASESQSTVFPGKVKLHTSPPQCVGTAKV